MSQKMILPMLLLTNHFVGLARLRLGDHTRVYLARAGGPLDDDDDKEDHVDNGHHDKEDHVDDGHHDRDDHES